ncbi:PREDICTED: probable peroxygenase 3 [Nelumbo nucifera]|uniref:Probable peroxygenase 3 n=1 Tax=Nelumbo nucifera TaxID=4432 RepID=A0A1U8B5C6_NELNU|nr:PREDICTED: probable peroxygenase 3 [Nelumbo nucifera]
MKKGQCLDSKRRNILKMFLPGFNVSSCSVPPYLYSCLFSKPFHLSINLSLNNKDKAFIANPSTGSKANSANTRSVNGGEAINGDQTALQKHVAFFDRNKDGLIYPWETFEGFRAIGCGIPLSVAAAIFINGVLSWQSRPVRPLISQSLSLILLNCALWVYMREDEYIPPIDAMLSVSDSWCHIKKRDENIGVKQDVRRILDEENVDYILDMYVLAKPTDDDALTIICEYRKWEKDDLGPSWDHVYKLLPFWDYRPISDQAGFGY